MDYEGEFNKASLETFIGMESFPLFGKIGPENYGKYAERGIPIAWVFLNAHGKESHVCGGTLYRIAYTLCEIVLQYHLTHVWSLLYLSKRKVRLKP